MRKTILYVVISLWILVVFSYIPNLTSGISSITIQNSTTLVNMTTGTSFWEENTNLTFRSYETSRAYLSWIVNGITWVSGWDSRLFIHNFNPPAKNASLNVTLNIVYNNTNWESFRLNDNTRSRSWDVQGNASKNITQLVSKFRTGAEIYSSPTIFNGYVYVGSHDYMLYQLNASNVSQMISSFNSTGRFLESSPAIYKGYVYIGNEDGYIYQLNASNVSQLISSYRTNNAVISSPLVINDYIYVGSNDWNLYQLNASDISINIANYTTDNKIQSSPAYYNGYIYIGSTGNINGTIFQLNASMISENIANFTMPGSIDRLTPVIYNNYLYIGSGDNNIYQINATNISQIINYYTTGGSITASSAAISSGYLYIGSDDKNIYQLSLNMTLISKYDTGGKIFSSPAVVNGYVYVASNGNVYQLDAYNLSNKIAEYKINNNNPVDRDFSSPAIYNGNLYIGSNDNYIYQLNSSDIENQHQYFNITIRSINPVIKIAYPTFGYYRNMSSMNYSAYDNYLDSCWYTLNSGVTNTTINCSLNITGLLSSEGSNTWRVYANDSAGNVNFAAITFIKDNINPDIKLTVSPVNNNIKVGLEFNDTYFGNATLMMFNSSYSLIDIYYSYNSPFNITFAGLSAGIYHINATAYDLAGNFNNSETKSFRITNTTNSSSGTNSTLIIEDITNSTVANPPANNQTVDNLPMFVEKNKNIFYWSLLIIFLLGVAYICYNYYKIGKREKEQNKQIQKSMKSDEKT